MKTRHTVLLFASLGITWASCGSKVQNQNPDAEDAAEVMDAFTDSGQLDVPEDLLTASEGCLGGSPAHVAVTIDQDHPDLELSTTDDLYECCNEWFCCERSAGLQYVSLDPAGGGDWQIQAQLAVCCIGPRSKVLMRVDASGTVLWMRTTCFNTEGTLAGSELRDSIPFGGGHLATYEVPGDLEISFEPDVELRYMNADGQIMWTLSGEDIGNAKWLTTISRTPDEHARFITRNDTQRFFLSVTPAGHAELVPLPDDFGGIMTDIPDLPEDEGIPLLLSNSESDGLGSTEHITYAYLNADGTIGVSKDVGTWKGKFGVSGVAATAIGPGSSGHLIIFSDNKSNIWELTLLDGDGDRVWSYEGAIESPDWSYCSREFLQLMSDGRLLVLGNRDLSPTNKFPYWGTLTSDGTTLDFQVMGDLGMPYANESGWTIRWIKQIGDRWLVKGSLPEAGDPATSGQIIVVAVYDSEFKLIHAYDYGISGTAYGTLAQQEDSWGMTLTRDISGLQCLADQYMQDVTTTFMTFERICE